MNNTTICPLCNEQNSCTVQTDSAACWCMSVELTDAQRRCLPEVTQCLCSSCLQKMIALNESL